MGEFAYKFVIVDAEMEGGTRNLFFVEFARTFAFLGKLYMPKLDILGNIYIYIYLYYLRALPLPPALTAAG